MTMNMIKHEMLLFEVFVVCMCPTTIIIIKIVVEVVAVGQEEVSFEPFFGCLQAIVLVVTVEIIGQIRELLLIVGQQAALSAFILEVANVQFLPRHRVFPIFRSDTETVQIVSEQSMGSRCVQSKWLFARVTWLELGC